MCVCVRVCVCVSSHYVLHCTSMLQWGNDDFIIIETSHTHTHTLSHTHINREVTHTHVVFPCFMGSFHKRNVFSTVQTVSSYSNPTPKATPHTQLTHIQNTSFCVIYKLVFSGDQKKFPTRTKLTDNRSGFVYHNVKL